MHDSLAFKTKSIFTYILCLCTDELYVCICCIHLVNERERAGKNDSNLFRLPLLSLSLSPSTPTVYRRAFSNCPGHYTHDVIIKKRLSPYNIFNSWHRINRIVYYWQPPSGVREQTTNSPIQTSQRKCITNQCRNVWLRVVFER